MSIVYITRGGGPDLVLKLRAWERSGVQRRMFGLSKDDGKQSTMGGRETIAAGNEDWSGLVLLWVTKLLDWPRSGSGRLS